MRALLPIKIFILCLTLACMPKSGGFSRAETLVIALALQPKETIGVSSYSYTASSGASATPVAIGFQTGNSATFTPTLILAPGVSSGTFSISPSLPSSLSFSETTGIISGTSSTPLAYTPYTISIPLTVAPNYRLTRSNPFLVTINLLIGSTFDIAARTCKFVGTAGGCANEAAGYTCTNANSCSSSATCANLSACGF